MKNSHLVILAILFIVGSVWFFRSRGAQAETISTPVPASILSVNQSNQSQSAPTLTAQQQWELGQKMPVSTSIPDLKPGDRLGAGWIPSESELQTAFPGNP